MNEDIAKKTYETFKDLDTVDLWNVLIDLDERIIIHQAAGKNINKKEIQRTSDKYFFECLEKSLVLIDLLKEKPKQQIYEIREYLNSKLYAANDTAKENIKSHIGFIDKELL